MCVCVWYRILPSSSQAVKSQTSTGSKPHPLVSKPTPPPPSVTVLDEAIITRKTHTIVDELSENNDYKVEETGHYMYLQQVWLGLEFPTSGVLVFLTQIQGVQFMVYAVLFLGGSFF